MLGRLADVDPTARRGWFYRSFARLSGTRPALVFSKLIGWKLDPWLLRASGGRLRSGLVLPMAVLETRGAKTGAVRRKAVIYFNDGDDVVIVASFAGAPKHPAWYHNLRANPDVRLNGVPMRATTVREQVELDRLWPLADQVFPPYAKYRRATAASGRTIPIMKLRRA